MRPFFPPREQAILNRSVKNIQYCEAYQSSDLPSEVSFLVFFFFVKNDSTYQKTTLEEVLAFVESILEPFESRNQ